MTTALVFLAAMAVTVGLQRGAAGVLTQPALERENYRGHRLPTAAGWLLVAAVIAVDGARTGLGVLGLGHASTDAARLGMLVGVIGFGLLGLLDDLLGDAHDRGLRGHLRALTEGRISTGFVKLAGGAALALSLAGALDGDEPRRVIVDGVLIALAANLGNLFDRAPGRTLKVGLAVMVPVAFVAGLGSTTAALAAVAGAGVVLLVGDLREEHMLGDTGANAVGAAVGVAVVLEASPTARAVVAVVLLALTLLSEVVSFSRIIDGVPPLRAFDRLGRRPEGAA
jgi:hypothetical protein